ncbi:MAG: radical SAM protein, partial [Anaerolineae bacterium]
MASTRGVLSQVLRSAYRKRVTAEFDYHLRDGYSAPFIQVDIKISNACNLRCKMCAQWNEVGWHKSQPISFVRDSIPLEVYTKMVDDVAKHKPWMFIYGGEPFVYPDLMPLLRYMKEKDLVVSVVTNGTMLAKHSPALVEMGMDFLLVS